MFLSYEYQEYLGYDEKTKQHHYRYKIIDSDFEAEVGAVAVAVAGGVEVAVAVAGGVAVAVAVAVAVVVAVVVAVIQEYSKRNLNVAANLVRAFQRHSKQYGYSISQIIEYNKKYNPDFNKYENDIEKYLCLI